jgi:hypothetical protein
MLSWTFILLLAGLILLGAFWQASLGVRERANHAAQEACARAQLQFLDGTVAFARIRLVRNEAGRVAFRRTYVFDYTAGSIERRQGFVVMLGQRIEHIGFERDRDIQSAPAHPGIDHVSAAHEGKVLNLEEWRRKRATRSDLSRRLPSESNHDSGKDNGW